MAVVLHFSAKHRRQILEHLIAHFPEEACGLIGGHEGHAEVILPVQNELHSPSDFCMDPFEQLKAFQWLDENRMELIGIYHSHPNGPAIPSEKDIQEHAYPGSVVLIGSKDGEEWTIRGFLIHDRQTDEVKLVYD